MKLHNTDCNSCPNTECLIKKHCSDSGAARLIEAKTSIRCKKSHNVIIEGSPVHGLYFVQSGIIKVYNTGINGREQILRFAKGGEMLGQRGFSTHQTYPIGAVAMQDGVLCHFTMPVMQEVLSKMPKLSYDFMVFFAEELYRSETKVRMFAHMTVREKVIDALLYINRKFGQHLGYLNLLLSRKDIADFAGTTEEQVIRTLSSLKKEGLIKTGGKRLGIPNADAMKQEINEHHYFIQS
nr:Crp/Fnr family transcriptional regulator [uncultured Carboxylicivirga sp.]